MRDANISRHNVNKVLTENTPTAYLTGEACLAPTVAPLAQSRNATLFFALKGQYNLAQGSALGLPCPQIYAPCKGSTLKPNVLHDVAQRFTLG